MRIQMLGQSTLTLLLLIFVVSCSSPDGLSSLTALLDALKNHDDLCVTIDEAYTESLKKDQFERWDEQS